MILNTPENRAQIRLYLESVDEDTFRDDIVIPLFGSQGFQVYRTNVHGPGEHGKDIIFFRYVPLFFDFEFVVVQTKAERVTAKNMVECRDQVERALSTKFAARSGDAQLLPHYVIFMNARTHSNEAYDKLPQMINDVHVKVLSQENVCDLIMHTGVAPQRLLEQLSTSAPDSQSEEDKLVFATILGGNPAEIDKLLDHRLKFVKDTISRSARDLVLDYIYDRWQMDPSWVGTVKPMKWFDAYFGFFTEKHSKYLLTVFEELTSSTPSFQALSYTKSVVDKVTPKLLAPVADEFVKLAAHSALSYPRYNSEIVLRKLRELVDSKLIESESSQLLADKVLRLEQSEREDKQDEAKKLYDDVMSILYPGRV